MNNCTEFQELISAYVDGELSIQERKRVEVHIQNCRECSDLLTIYREISLASEESMVEAPDSLLKGVMNGLPSGAASQSGGQKNKRSLRRTVLLRYAPLAACLAIILFILPRTPGFGCSSQNMKSDLGSIMTSGSGAGMSGSASQSNNAAPPPGAATGGGMPEAAIDKNFDEAGGYDNDAFTGAGHASPGNSSDNESSVAPEPAPSPGVSLTVPEEEANMEAPAPGGDRDGQTSAGGGSGFSSNTADPVDDTANGGEVVITEDIEDSRPDYYAHITITGELPLSLDHYEQFMVAVDDYTFCITISRDEAIKLISEEKSDSNVTAFEIIDENAETAMVFILK